MGQLDPYSADDDRTVRELGERSVVANLTSAMRLPEFLLDGYGHDAAFVDILLGSNEVLAINTDRSGINIAYKLGLAGPECIGDLGISHAVSDIVVAGGTPRAITIGLLLPPETTMGFVRGVMRGAEVAAERYGASIVGGDTKQNPKFAIVVTAIGTVLRDKRLGRSGARPGDALVVTGTLGSMLLGRMTLRNPVEIDDDTRLILTNALVEQRPPFHLGLAVAKSGIAHAGIDISDGLPGAIHAICGASGLGALVDEDRIPLHSRLTGIIKSSGLTPLSLSAAGGDWQYLYSIPTGQLATLKELAEVAGTAVTEIGRVIERPILAVRTIDREWRELKRIEHDSFADSATGGGHFDNISPQMSCVGELLDERQCDILFGVNA
ncbi:thiamine-monophosphate kinase [Thioalkalivibrio sp. XN279]|uniref:thiamine-phosphate kinase n=1 Tax=Thioalkalivibrio sp. XN279 TaxID=2714953 RepID=UPI001F0F684C|nr:thiamine-phosphate kinase [Thioalkalivibrio sp. XN279]